MGMTKREQKLEEEVATLRSEVAGLKEQVRQLVVANAQLRQELDKFKQEPPFFVKPNTPKDKDKAEKQPRRKRAKGLNPFSECFLLLSAPSTP